MNTIRVILLTSFLVTIFYGKPVEANCTYCYQIASVEITLRNKTIQNGYISWSPNQPVNLNEKAFLEEAQKNQRIRFFKYLSKKNFGTEENEVSAYYALAKNVILLRRFDIKKLRIIDSNFGSSRSDIQIIKK
ncbi:MAG TPA: hypothetical protein PK079_04760 [Leptospiraceae bacterium]|nr:hypothetical protein [Leptospiraceae bacterium]HMW04969.1 hypothetical protein [Leptospiraceae bacterium]HMX31882.1 hypothetical protein [Leptospiraceae bacterium]HMY30810.1 hypothetical protein [Leptospiraceae bacterium]HMZ64271.1 hypothetical protein [Leptospiraceae bacterium]